MKNIIKRFLFISIIILAILIVLQSSSYCGDIVSQMDYTNMNAEVNKMTTGLNIAFRLIQYAGTGIALIMVMILGMKYMLSSVEEKAEIKKQAIPVFVGSGFIFAASQLVAIVGKFMD